MTKDAVDDVCRHFPELSFALEEVATLRARQFLVNPSHPLKEGDFVKVTKSGSSYFGRKAKVVDPHWNGLVKVTLIGDSVFKSYKRDEVEVDLSVLRKVIIDDMVKIIKS